MPAWAWFLVLMTIGAWLNWTMSNYRDRIGKRFAAYERGSLPQQAQYDFYKESLGLLHEVLMFVGVVAFLLGVLVFQNI